MTDRKTKLSAPWLTYFHKLEALFGKDPQIELEFEDYVITIYVYNEEKADALIKLLPVQKVFGNIVVDIDVVPSGENINSDIELFKKAFKGNPVVDYVTSTDGAFKADYIVFKNEVVQFFNDQLDDPFGNISTLYQDIAKEVFEGTTSVHFCTNLPEKSTVETAVDYSDIASSDMEKVSNELDELLKKFNLKD